jgi:hypothetical protein
MASPVPENGFVEREATPGFATYFMTLAQAPPPIGLRAFFEATTCPGSVVLRRLMPWN